MWLRSEIEIAATASVYPFFFFLKEQTRYLHLSIIRLKNFLRVDQLS